LENRIKQKEVAKLLNVSHVTVSQKINGTLDFSFSEVEKICQHYGIELDIFSTKKLRNSNTKLA
jgi:transcriptional regulator with XRE-family HTH domain